MIYAMLTKPGERDHNEDHLGALQLDKDNEMFIAADGLGGHERGEVASSLAVETSLDIFRSSVGQDPRKILSDCFEAAQKAVLSGQTAGASVNDRGMKTTMTILLHSGNTLCWGHIGDSRLYLFRKDGSYIRTADHSVPQMLVLSGEIKESDIRGHEDRNRLLRVIGSPWGHSSYELSKPLRFSGDLFFLLCTDGFWEWITEAKMAELLKESASPGEWLEKMENTVLENGSGNHMDNYSALAVFSGPGRKKLFGLF